MRLNNWDLRQVLNVVKEAEFLTVSGRLFQVSAEAQLKQRRPKLAFNDHI